MKNLLQIKYLHLAIKNIVRNKIRTFFLMIAIIFGTMVLIVISSLSNGIVDNFYNNLCNLWMGHIVVEGFEKISKNDNTKYTVSIIRNNDVEKKIRELFPDLDYISKLSKSYANITNGSSTVYQQVVGLDFTAAERIKNLLYFKSGSVENMKNKNGIFISSKIADKLQVELNDYVLIEIKTAYGQKNVGEAVVAGVLSPDMGLYSVNTSYVNKQYMNELLNIKQDEYNSLNVYFKKAVNIEQKAMLLQRELEKEYQVIPRPVNRIERSQIRRSFEKTDWKDTLYKITSIEESFQEVVMLSNFLNLITIVVIVVLFGIIIVGITNSIRMSIFERKSEIGTLRALGLTKIKVQVLFIVETFCISILSCIIGLLLSLFLMLVLSVFQLNVTETVFSLFLRNRQLHFYLVPDLVINYIVLITFFTVIAAYFPSRKAAKIEPAKVIQ